MKRLNVMMWAAALAGSWSMGCVIGDDPTDVSSVGQAVKKSPYGAGYQVSLQDIVRFEPIQPGSDADSGRALFGVAADLTTQDPTGALFEGPSIAAGREIVGNGRTCFSCHRGNEFNFGLPQPPLMDHIPADDPIFTGFDADAQGDPRAFDILNQLGLVKYRPNRFNQARTQDDPYRQVFFWRKSPALLNIGFAHGFLNDGRGRAMLETDRGAVFSHTQSSDDRFDDLFTGQAARDMTAFQFSLVTDPALLALRDPSDPMYDTLVDDPFYTVPVETAAQHRGQEVFEESCMGCHNTPQIFNHLGNVEALGSDGLTPEFPPFAPHTSRTFNIGVAERNAHNLPFTRPTGDGNYEPVVIPLANEDGSVNMHTVTFDIGMAATTGRTVDIGRFRVPQLRDVRNLAPYFHDNSAATLEEVVDYFNSDDYNNSADGQLFPIHLNAQQRADLLEFLYIL